MPVTFQHQDMALRSAVFVYLILLCSFLTVYAQIPDVHDCITPNSTLGLCVEMKDCPQLEKLFEEQNFTLEAIAYLRRSQCGYADLQPEVCCPVSKTPRTFQLPKSTPERAPPAFQLSNRFGDPGHALPQPGICGIQTFDNRIFDGEIAAIDEFPWMALLEYSKKNRYKHGFACGGALINPKYVLTAAHCAKGPTVDALGGLTSVRLGEHNILTDVDCDAINVHDCAPPPLDIKIEKAIVHPNYVPSSSDQHHDIALLKLVEEVPYSDFICPICLSKNLSSNTLATGRIQFVSGWGQTEKGTNSPVKLKIKVPIVQPDSCSKVYSRYGINIGTRQICAGGERRKDTCSGDSGGPLVVSLSYPGEGAVWFATGVVSIGPTPCAQRGVPGVYTKITDYYDWIEENIK